MERETRIVETPLGRKIAIKTFFTQMERGQVVKLITGNSVATEGGTEGTKVSDLLDAQSKAVELAVVSIDGETNDCFKKLTEEFPSGEYDTVSAEVIKLIESDLKIAK